MDSFDNNADGDPWQQIEFGRFDEIMLGLDALQPPSDTPPLAASSSTGHDFEADETPFYGGDLEPSYQCLNAEFVDPRALSISKIPPQGIASADPQLASAPANEMLEVMDFEYSPMESRWLIETKQLQHLERHKKDLEIQRQIIAIENQQHEIWCQRQFVTPTFSDSLLHSRPFDVPIRADHSAVHMSCDSVLDSMASDSNDGMRNQRQNKPANMMPTTRLGSELDLASLRNCTGDLQYSQDALQGVSSTERSERRERATLSPGDYSGLQQIHEPSPNAIRSRSSGSPSPTRQVMFTHQACLPRNGFMLDTGTSTDMFTPTLLKSKRLTSGIVKTRVNKASKRYPDLEQKKLQAQLQRSIARPLDPRMAMLVFEVEGYQTALSDEKSGERKKRIKRPNGTACLRCKRLKKPVKSYILAPCCKTDKYRSALGPNNVGCACSFFPHSFLAGLLRSNGLVTYA